MGDKNINCWRNYNIQEHRMEDGIEERVAYTFQRDLVVLIYEMAKGKAQISKEISEKFKMCYNSDVKIVKKK